MNIAIIPARGGSKRIPRKNIKLFHGKPIIAYSIECARASGCFDRIIVSTDDAEIADIAQQYGAEVPFIRPAELADDYCGTLDVMAHAAQWFVEHNQPASHLCCIYPTAPLLLPSDLRKAYETLRSPTPLKYVFSVVEYAYPVQRALTFTDNGLAMCMPEHRLTRSQDLPKTYHDAGQFYWGTNDAFLLKQPIFEAHSGILELPVTRVQDIDTPQDWQFAESLYQHYIAPNHENCISS